MQDTAVLRTRLSNAAAVVAGGLASKAIVSIGSVALGSGAASAIPVQVAGVSLAFFLGSILTGFLIRGGSRNALSRAAPTPGLWWVIVLLMLGQEGREMALVFGGPVVIASYMGVRVGLFLAPGRRSASVTGGSDEIESGAEGVPVMVYDWQDGNIREIADNIWHAQMAGWPRILTYVHRSRDAKRAIRGESLRQVPRIESRDEYPFASTVENSGSVWVGHAPVSQQNAQGNLMNRFYREHGAYTEGARLRFEVRVINHPNGDVTAPITTEHDGDVR